MSSWFRTNVSKQPCEKQFCGIPAFIVLFVSAGASCCFAADPATFPTTFPTTNTVDRSDAGPLEGKWLPQAIDGWHCSMLDEVHHSVLTIHGTTFSMTNYRWVHNDISGTLSINPTSNPKTIDLDTPTINYNPANSLENYPAMHVSGIYKLDEDALTVCLQTGSNPVRPKTFSDETDGAIVLVFQRAEAGFVDYPKSVTLTVRDDKGQPVKGQAVSSFLNMGGDPHDPAAARRPQYKPACVTDESGQVKIPYDDFDVAEIYDAAAHSTGFVTASPAALQNGKATLTIKPVWHFDL